MVIPLRRRCQSLYLGCRTRGGLRRSHISLYAVRLVGTFAFDSVGRSVCVYVYINIDSDENRHKDR